MAQEEGNGPKTTHYTIMEGGKWYPFEPGKGTHIRNVVHSIKFENGAIWDAINGWRKPSEEK